MGKQLEFCTACGEDCVKSCSKCGKFRAKMTLTRRESDGDCEGWVCHACAGKSSIRVVLIESKIS